MKSLFTLLLIIVSFSLNSQILGWHLDDISKHVDCQNLEYFVNEHCQLTHISSRMDTCTFVEYLKPVAGY